MIRAAAETSIQIEERAAAWLTQRDSGEWTEADQRALQAWLDASPAHEVAFIRLEAIWNTADRLQALGPAVTPDAVPPPSTWHLPPTPRVRARLSRHPRRRFLAIAAGVVVALAGASYWLQISTVTYRTAVGGLTSVPMKDGSRVTLNTDSEIRLPIGAEERVVRLERGEAFFEVAPDPDRPFVVRAGHQRVVAVGTQFSVRRTGQDALRVVVTEGRVRVEDDSSPTPILLDAGGIVRADAQGLQVAPQQSSKAEELVSWRTGFLVFRDVPLVEAAAEFNRYNARKLQVQDASIANISVSGRFRTTNFEAFVRLVQNGFPVEAQTSANGIVLKQRRISTAIE